jgi:hypothetical protein
MMGILFSLLSLTNVLLGFIIVIFLSYSNLKFTKGEIQRIINNFVWGTILMFGAMTAQFQVEFFNLAETPIDIIRYIFFFGSLAYYLAASFEIYKMSKVLGFASEEMPEKLKKVLKS